MDFYKGGDGVKILLVDDEKSFVRALKYNLTQDGYETVTAYDGMEALEKVKSEKPDLVILDIMLPEKDGWEVCRLIRQHSNVPVIMLTAKDDETDKIIGLELGADDYITKPFSVRELLARIKALLRRVQLDAAKNEKQILESGDLKMDFERHRVYRDGVRIDLTAKEFELLHILMRSPGKVFSRDSLLEEVWGYDYFGGTRTVDVHVRRLREKIEQDPGNPHYIITVWGAGYAFYAPDLI
jgi:DNA-binding response OmpR family regulator